jgi:S-adenosyl-L-methionine methyltransferase
MIAAGGGPRSRGGACASAFERREQDPCWPDHDGDNLAARCGTRQDGRGMSRLDSFIRRLEAQRACLNASPRLIAGLPGPILELGLGNGRTFDHLRCLYPGRAIFVFERQPAAHPDCVPDAARLVLGDIRATLPTALDWLPSRAALVHNDLGTGDAGSNSQLGRWLSEVLPPLLRPGGIVLSDQPLEHAALLPGELPGTLPEGRYFLYRRLPDAPGADDAVAMPERGARHGSGGSPPLPGARP